MPLDLPGVSPDEAPFHTCRFNAEWLSFVVGVLQQFLDDDDLWEPVASGQIDELLSQIAAEYLPVTTPVGLVSAFAGSVIPSGWRRCDGSAVSRLEFASLYAVLGTIHGAGDGSTTFNLPDYRGRTLIGAGQGAGLTSRVLGGMVGSEVHKLTVAEMPSHTHRGRWSAVGMPGGNYGSYTYGTPYNNDGALVESSGGDVAHNNMQPSAVVEYIIYAGQP